jgi:hypothetical protein
VPEISPTNIKVRLTGRCQGLPREVCNLLTSRGRCQHRMLFNVSVCFCFFSLSAAQSNPDQNQHQHNKQLRYRVRSIDRSTQPHLHCIALLSFCWQFAHFFAHNFCSSPKLKQHSFPTTQISTKHNEYHRIDITVTITIITPRTQSHCVYRDVPENWETGCTSTVCTEVV